ncbi:hypothetical protein FAM09_23370 [Niastella caeni]|uniref:Uncharacterized protein n=1 Tax=Niastella caeni TaxID=2569763 RepID=A0A4S8HMB6_9BACT|nr:hypothetical protein [Niastella caeni]THU34934.1 hypothetical protein FAM09_23370 [Niastella caeni]
MEDYLQSLRYLTNEFLNSDSKDSIQFINVEFNTEPLPFKGMFIIADSRRLLIPSNMPFELVIFVTFTYLTPLGKKLEELMCTSEAFNNFDHTLVGKTSTYVLKTGNNIELIESTIREIIDRVFPSVDKSNIIVSIIKTTGILGYLTDPGLTV